ncbi:MoaD/ThiS family protein [Vulcanisaeta souniana]|nr:MoaD/ThiS family protein [Vulcanisaeta souniana]
MKIQVKFLTILYEKTKTLKAEIELPEGSTLLELIKKIDSNIYQGFSKLILDCNNKVREKFLVMINGRSIDFLEGINTRLRDGDEVTFLPHCGIA